MKQSKLPIVPKQLVLLREGDHFAYNYVRNGRFTEFLTFGLKNIEEHEVESITSREPIMVGDVTCWPMSDGEHCALMALSSERGIRSWEKRLGLVSV